MENILAQNKQSWDNMADEWFGTTALPTYGCYIPTEDKLHLFGDVSGKRVLDIGCGSGHSLKWHGDNGAAELWGLDVSSRQIENAGRYLKESGYSPILVNAPMEREYGIPKGYFDIAYSIYAIGWTTDLAATFALVSSYLKQGGIFIFSWDHPFMHAVEARDNQLIFCGNYNIDETFTFEKGGNPVTVFNRKLSTYVNTLAQSGFCVEQIVEQTDAATMAAEHDFAEKYYSPYKAKFFPQSFIVKARKL